MEFSGQTVGGYQIETSIGSGGMGQVFRARQIQTGRVVAFKVLHQQYASEPTFQARFLQEAQAAAALTHPNIIEIYDFGQQDNWYYLVMELASDGSLRTLQQRLASGERVLPLWQSIDLVRQAADGLGYAHIHEMIHRDIKPDNLLLVRSNMPGEPQNQFLVKISDFGLAKLAEGGVNTTQGLTIGTPAYMSPEQCQGIPLDGRSDIYSLGVVLYEVATGLLPFETRSLTDAVYKHVYTEPPPPRKVRADLPETLERVILRCLRKSPDERFSTAAELSLQLQILAQTLRGGPQGIQTFVPGTSQPASSSQPDRRGGFRLRFDSDRQILVPGQPAVITATLTSQDDAQLEVNLSLEDVPATWLSAPLLSVSLEPGTEQSVALPVLVPRTPDSRAGDYRATLTASDQKSPGQHQSASAVWSVAQFDEVEFELSPSQSSGWIGAGFSISLSNRGNSATRVELNTAISEPSFSTEMRRPIVDLAPGESVRTNVRVQMGARWTGGRSGSLTVEARVAGAQARSAVATFTQRPLLPVVVPVVSLILIGGFLGGFFLLNRGGSATGNTPTAAAVPTSSAPVVAVPSTVTPTSPAPPTPTQAPSPTPTPPPVTVTATLPPVVVSPQPTATAPTPPMPYILFTTGRGQPPGILEIYSINPDGSGLHAITNNNQDDWEPAISPDGSQIAFVSTRDGRNQIYIMNADGSNQTRLTSNPGSDEYPNWSPVGSKISFSHTIDNKTSLFVMNADGTDLTELAPTVTGSNWAQTWSPDGTQIAFVSDRTGHRNLYEVNVDGSNLRQLTSSADDEAPRWSHDGQHIVFMSRRDGNFEIYVMNADGSNQTRLTDTPEDEIDPVWSPDDQTIAFADNREIVLMHMDGTQRTTLTSGAGYDSWLRWSPDGKYLAFASKPEGQPDELYVVNLDGGALTRLTNNPTFDGNEAWVPLLP